MDGDFAVLEKARKQRDLKRKLSRGFNRNISTITESTDVPEVGSSITATDLKPVDQVTTDALFVAAAEDNLDEVVKLFKGSISSQNLMQYVKPQTSTTLLHHALINKAKNVANALIDAGADAYIASEFTTEVAGIETKKTVLHVLAEMGEYTLTKKILDKISKRTKSSLLLKTTAYKFEGQRPRQLSCCHIASAFGHQNLVELYIDHGLDVNHQNKKKDSAIHWACRYGHHKLVHYLIQKGSLVDVQNDKGSSPIHWSIRYGHTEVLRTLIQVGKANVHLQRKLGLMAPIVHGQKWGVNMASHPIVLRTIERKQYGRLDSSACMQSNGATCNFSYF